MVGRVTEHIRLLGNVLRQQGITADGVTQKWQEEHAIKGSTMSRVALPLWVVLLFFLH
jgi:hypothetical protein